MGFNDAEHNRIQPGGEIDLPGQGILGSPGGPGGVIAPLAVLRFF